jgi:hypothetical protein
MELDEGRFLNIFNQIQQFSGDQNESDNDEDMEELKQVTFVDPKKIDETTEDEKKPGKDVYQFKSACEKTIELRPSLLAIAELPHEAMSILQSNPKSMAKYENFLSDFQ